MCHLGTATSRGLVIVGDNETVLGNHKARSQRGRSAGPIVSGTVVEELFKRRAFRYDPLGTGPARDNCGRGDVDHCGANFLCQIRKTCRGAAGICWHRCQHNCAERQQGRQGDSKHRQGHFWLGRYLDSTSGRLSATRKVFRQILQCKLLVRLHFLHRSDCIKRGNSARCELRSRDVCANGQVFGPDITVL